MGERPRTCVGSGNYIWHKTYLWTAHDVWIKILTIEKAPAGYGACNPSTQEEGLGG